MVWVARCIAPLLCAWLVAGCSGVVESEPLVEYSTEIVIQGDSPQSFVRPLRAGVYLVEVRERDIDLRVGVDAGTMHTDLGDAFLRHGLHRTVVSTEGATTLRVTLASVDQRSWRGSAAVRILRWPRAAYEATPDERLLGFAALGAGSALGAKESRDDWLDAITPLRSAAEHFRRANDLRSLAEAEYQRAWIELSLLLDPDTARRTGEAAMSHFHAVDDELGAQRASLLIAEAEIGLAVERKGTERELRLASVARRLADAGQFFELDEQATDALRVLTLQATADKVRGRTERLADIYGAIRQRAHARGDKLFEAAAIQNLASVASRSGDVARAANMYESVLPLIERERNPDLYATIVGELGSALIALGDFDRALTLQTEALELFSKRGDDGRTARTLTALGAIQFRTGNVERAYESLRSAQPLYERAADAGGQASSLRLLGNATAALGQHDLALEYLRKAERLGDDRDSLAQTRVLIAGELRTLGDLRGAEALLDEVLQTRNEQTRADALAERARVRQRQHREKEALADLRSADAAYEALRLDFNRIDTSAALALAYLEIGDATAASQAADTAVMLEKRIRVKSANPELRAGFLSASYAPYEARIEVDLAGGPPRDTGATWRAFRTAETVRARSLADRMSAAAPRGPLDPEAEAFREKLTALQVELERRLRHPAEDGRDVLEIRREIEETRAQVETRTLASNGVSATAAPALAASREEMQAALPADTAVLAYFVGDVRSHAWLLSRKDFRHAVLPGRHALQNIVATFVEQQRSAVRSASDSVFAPLLANLLNGVPVHRLLVLPDGPLNGLPFAALPMPHGQPREMLVDRFVVSVAPSLELALRPAARAGDHTRVAVISDPVYTPDDRRLTLAASTGRNYRGIETADDGLSRLPYSAIEARAVARAFEGLDVIELAGFNATARRVLALPSEDLGVLHFATHAVTRRDSPEQSALFLSEFAADGTPLAKDRLTAEDIARSGLRADVVVLSGCATGDGRELRGEGVLGLTYRFLANGSHTVVASLWPVEDALTARFMEEFYTAYRASGRAPDALRTAQLKMRSMAPASVWATFVIRANALP